MSKVPWFTEKKPMESLRVVYSVDYDNPDYYLNQAFSFAGGGKEGQAALNQIKAFPQDQRYQEFYDRFPHAEKGQTAPRDEDIEPKSGVTLRDLGNVPFNCPNYWADQAFHQRRSQADYNKVLAKPWDQRKMEFYKLFS